MQDYKDMGKGSFGVCLNDPAFEPFVKEILENGDFSNCYDLYLEKRFDGDKEPCDQFAEIEEAEIPDGMDIETYIHIEAMKHQNVDALIEYLRSPNARIVFYKGTRAKDYRSVCQ